MSNKDHWDQVYKNKHHREVSWYQQRPVTSLELINSLSLDDNDEIIDVGGGASTLVDHLISSGHKKVTVLDVSSEALNQARHRLGNHASLVTWINTDITAFKPDNKYTLWHDRAVFHFLTSRDDRESYISALIAATHPGAHVIIAAFSPDGPEKCSGLDIVQYDAEKLTSEFPAMITHVKSTYEAHLTPNGASQHFGYHLFTRQ